MKAHGRKVRAARRRTAERMREAGLDPNSAQARAQFAGRELAEIVGRHAEAHRRRNTKL